MIKVENLKKNFDGFYALDGVNLHVEKGSVYALVGPNGAGKSTLIRHLTGVYKQTEGNILIDGQPVYENEEIKKRIAYIPDDLFYFMQANVRDMMKFYKGIYKNFSVERFEKLLGVFELVNKKPIRRMSKGMQKQAAFLLAISTMADIIILDEPVDGLDPVMRRQVWSLLMQDVAERGTTVLLSSHNLRELEDVCDTVGIMNKGKIMLEKSLTSLQGNVTKLQIAFGDNAPAEIISAVEHFENLHRLGNVSGISQEDTLNDKSSAAETATETQTKTTETQTKSAASQTKPTASQTKPTETQTKPASSQTKPASSQPQPTAHKSIKGLEILHAQKNGSIYTLILRGDNDTVQKKMAELKPALSDAIPLTLEEIFIYELGGENYAVKEILL